VFDLPSEGGDPPFIFDNSVKQDLTDVVARLFSDESELKGVKIHSNTQHIKLHKECGC
jgi:hypothetical protein